MEKKTDLRIIKTKNLLYNTLTELMETSSFEDIKVSDICNHALINRSTFYSHYSDKYELLLDYIDNIKKELVSELKNNPNELNTKEYYIELIKLFLNHIDDKKQIYSSIMINNRDSIVMDILSGVINDEIIDKLEKENKKDLIPKNLIAKFYIGGVVNIGIEYITNNKYTKEEIIEYLSHLLPDNIY